MRKIILLFLYNKINNLPPLRIELRLAVFKTAVYKTAVIPLNYRGLFR